MMKSEGIKGNIVIGKWGLVCMADGCGREARTAGYCPRHYQQIRRHGRLTPEREYHRRGNRCMVEHCEEPQIAKGYCFRHYQQMRRYGRLTPERERIYGRLGCRVAGCREPHSSRGYCKRHYMSEYYLPRLARTAAPFRARAQA
jgi:hypothetical protein